MTPKVMNAAMAAADLMTDAPVEKARAVIEAAEGKAAHAILKALGLKVGEKPTDEVIEELKLAYIGDKRNTILMGPEPHLPEHIKGLSERFGAYVKRMSERDPKHVYWTIEDSKKGKVMRLTADGETSRKSANSSWSALTLALDWRKRAPGRKSNEYECPCCGKLLVIKGQGKTRELAKAPTND